MSGGFIVIVVVAVAITGYLAYRSYQRDQQRVEQLFAWATANHMTFAVEDDDFCSRWAGSPFGEGDHRRARNVVIGQFQGRGFAAFDYTYETHSSDGRGNTTTTTHRFAVTSLGLPTALPSLQVTPESVFSRIGNALGVSDIELESEDFNRAFRVHSHDPKFATDVLNPRTMQMLLAQPHISWRITGTDIVCWESGKMTPAVCTAASSRLAAVLGGIPSFVWKDNGYDAGSPAVGETS